MPVKTVTLAVAAITDKANREIAATGAYFEKLRAANPVELTVKLNRLQAIAESKILAREMAATVTDTVKLDMDRSAFGTGLGGIFTRGLFGGGAGAAIPLTAGLGIASLPLLTSGILGIVPALVAAAGGVAAFGALSIPTFAKITQALSGTKNAMAGLSPAQQDIVRGVVALKDQWGKMAAAFAPALTPILATLTDIARKLLPGLLPFAQAAAGAIGTLLQQFDKFASSPGFKAFQAEMLKLSGPAILAIGQGLGQVAVAAGKLLIALSSPSALRDLRVFFEIIAGAITGLAAFFAWATARFNNSVREVSTWARVLTRFFTSTIPAAFGILVASARIAFDELEIAGLRSALGITTAFGHLPGPLGAPFRSASAAIRRDLAGILGDVTNNVNRISALWATLNGQTSTLVLNITTAGQGPIPGKTFPRGFAAGTMSASPGWAWVGEHGPELMRMTGGEVVIPSSVARGYAAGAGRNPQIDELIGAVQENTDVLASAIGALAGVTAQAPAVMGAAAAGGARASAYAELYR